jgi:hypothetical protein
MGEVFRAIDTTSGSAVEIKITREHKFEKGFSMRPSHAVIDKSLGA